MIQWNIPNVITVLRIVLIGVFGVLLIQGHDAWAITVLAIAGASDFLDGYLARKWNQTTELGRILDPAADRILTVVVVLGLAVRGIIPWWLVGLLLARDAVVGLMLLWGRKAGAAAPQVTLVGKAATAALYVFLPLAYLAYERWPVVHVVSIVGAALAAVLYWWSGWGYVQAIRNGAKSGTSPTDASQEFRLE